MPDLVKLYIRSCVIGFILAALFVAILLWFNVMNLWYLVTHNDAGLMAVGLLWFMNGIVFSGVQFGYAVMQLGRDDDDDEPRGGTRIREHATVPVRAEARHRFRR